VTGPDDCRRRLDGLDDRVHMAREHLFGHAQRVTLRDMESHMRRLRHYKAINHGIDHHCWWGQGPLHKSLHTNKPTEPNEPNSCRQPPPLPIDSARPSGCCHGRGRGFESRRPRHSFQKSCSDFAGTIEDPKGHVFAPFFVSLLARSSGRKVSLTLQRQWTKANARLDSLQ